MNFDHMITITPDSDNIHCGNCKWRIIDVCNIFETILDIVPGHEIINKRILRCAACTESQEKISPSKCPDCGHNHYEQCKVLIDQDEYCWCEDRHAASRNS